MIEKSPTPGAPLFDFPPDAPPQLYDNALLEIRAANENVVDALESLIPELRLKASECEPDAVELGAAEVAQLKQAFMEQGRSANRLRAEVQRLQSLKAERKAEAEIMKQERKRNQLELCVQREKLISCYRRTLEHLGLGMRLQLEAPQQSSGDQKTAAPAVWKLQYTYGSYELVLLYDDVGDTFELLKMTPALATLDQIRSQMQRQQRDGVLSSIVVRCVLCAWRNYCAKLEKVNDPTDGGRDSASSAPNAAAVETAANRSPPEQMEH